MTDPTAEFIRLFNNEAFFEAHEVLEAVWRKENGEARDFYQGLIQLAAALVHVQRGNRYGAVSLLGKAAGLLGKYPEGYLGFQPVKLLAEMRAFIGGKTAGAPKISRTAGI